jgi:hypothetical protein
MAVGEAESVLSSRAFQSVRSPRCTRVGLVLWFCVWYLLLSSPLHSGKKLVFSLYIEKNIATLCSKINFPITKWYLQMLCKASRLLRRWTTIFYLWGPLDRSAEPLSKCSSVSWPCSSHTWAWTQVVFCPFPKICSAPDWLMAWFSFSPLLTLTLVPLFWFSFASDFYL